MLTNALRIAAGLAATAATGFAVYYTANHILNKRVVEEIKALPEGEAKIVEDTRDSISYLLMLFARQIDKRPMFLTSTDALRVRAIRLTWSSKSNSAELIEMLDTLKAIYDGAEKRT